MKRDQHIAVEVRVDGEGILTLETSCLAGVPDIDQYDEELRWCAHHLLSFIGDPHPDASEAREADLKAKLTQLVDAWEATPAGLQSVRVIEEWLQRDMKPAIDEARKAIGRSVPA